MGFLPALLSFGSIFTNIVRALPVTLLITFSAFAAGTLFACLFTVARVRNIKILAGLSGGLISFLRGTPLLVQIFLSYYGLPAVMKLAGIDISGFNIILFPVAAMALNCSAFLSEIMRSAYLGVNKGQIEAAYSVGMNSLQMFWRILFPQAFKIALPNLGNFIIDLLKDTSMVFSIGIVDIMGQARNLSAASYGIYQLQSFLAVSLLYWIVCILLEKGVSIFEKSYGKGQKDIGSGNKAV